MIDTGRLAVIREIAERQHDERSDGAWGYVDELVRMVDRLRATEVQGGIVMEMLKGAELRERLIEEGKQTSRYQSMVGADGVRFRIGDDVEFASIDGAWSDPRLQIFPHVGYVVEIQRLGQYVATINVPNELTGYDRFRVPKRRVRKARS